MSLTSIRRPKSKRVPAFAVTSLPMKTFTLDAYHRLIGSGALTTSDRMELLNGLLVYKMPQNSPHASTALKLESLGWRRLPSQLMPWCQKPITISDSDSEPEPDLAIVPAPGTRYETKKPVPSEIALLIEISDTTLALDSGEKKETYAAAGIPVYWIVNLVDRRIEVYSSPKSGKHPDYRDVSHYRPGQVVAATMMGIAIEPIAVNDILPAPVRRPR